MPTQLFGTQAVPAGNISVTILGNFGGLSLGTTAYQVNALVNSAIWNSNVAVSNKTVSSFDLTFDVPAPPNASVDWFVVGPTTVIGGISTLQDYLDETRRLLRDENTAPGLSQLYTTTDLVAFINRAMRQRDLEMGINRILVSFPMVARQFAYNISDILTNGQVLTGGSGVVALTVPVTAGSVTVTVNGAFVPGFEVVGATASWFTNVAVTNLTASSFELLFSNPCPPLGGFVDVVITGIGILQRPNVIDVASIVITPLGQPPGGIRYPLGRWPFTRLTYLLSTSYPTYPVAYAMYGFGQINVAPPPANPYPTQWDFWGYASALVNLTDADPMPYPWTDPIPWWAAHFAKMSVQRFDEAKEFLQEAQTRTRMVTARGRPMAVVSPWSDLPRNAR